MGVIASLWKLSREVFPDEGRGENEYEGKTGEEEWMKDSENTKREGAQDE